MTRRHAWLLVACLAVAVALRVAAAQLAAAPPTRDELEYHRLALGLLEGDGYALEPGRPITHRPPLYPAFLAGVYAAAGPSPEAARHVQAVMHGGTTLLVAALGRVLFTAPVGLAAAALFAVHPALETVATLHRESLLVPLLTGCVLALVLAIRSGRLGWWALGGALAGLLALTNQVYLAFMPALVTLGLADRRVRARWRGLAVAAALVAALWLPWQAWTLAAGGGPEEQEFRYHALVFGHFPVLSGSFWWPVADMTALEGQRERARAYLAERAGAEAALPMTGRMTRARHELRERIGAQPLAWLGFVVNRGVLVAASPPPGSSWLRAAHPVLGAGAFALNAVFVALAAAVLIVARRRDAGAGPVLAAIVTVVGAHALLHGIRRYGYPLQPLWLVLGVGGCSMLAVAARPLLARVWYAVFTERPAGVGGRLAVGLVTAAYRRHIEESLFTGRGPTGLLADAVRAELCRRAYAAEAATRAALWRGAAGKAWHDLAHTRLADPEERAREFETVRGPLVAALEDMANAGRVTTVCEIGTGNGLFLEHLATRLGAVKRLVGLDLSEAQIRDNRARPADVRLEFVVADAAEWVDRHAEPHTGFVACETLEFLREDEMLRLLAHIRAHVPGGAVAVLAGSSLEQGTGAASVPRAATAFHHDYATLLRRAGFTVTRLHVARDRPYDRVTVVGVAAETAA